MDGPQRYKNSARFYRTRICCSNYFGNMLPVICVLLNVEQKPYRNQHKEPNRRIVTETKLQFGVVVKVLQTGSVVLYCKR